MMNQEMVAWMKSGHATNWEVLSYLENCISWIKTNTIGRGGIAFSDKQQLVHTNITERLIPLLEHFGEKDLAQQYKRYLNRIPKGGIFDQEVGPKDVDEAITMTKYEESSYLRGLAMLFLLEHSYDISAVEKVLVKDLEAMDKTGIMLDKAVHRILPASLYLYAALCYKIGHFRRGDKLLQTVCALQRKSGGWFGSSRGKPQFDYFNTEEICWANLHFLEAIKAYDEAQRLAFPKSKFGPDEITVLHRIKKSLPPLNEESNTLFIGNEGWKNPLSNAVEGRVKFWSKLAMNIDAESDSFDLVVSVLSMSFGLRPKKMIKELFRVCKPNGLVILIDRNAQKARHFQLMPNEQWFEATKINREVGDYGTADNYYFKVYNVPELYIMWRGTKRPVQVARVSRMRG